MERPMIKRDQSIQLYLIYTGKKLIIPILVIFFLSIASLEAWCQVYESSNGHVEFDSSVPLHSFTGQSDKLVGQINLSNGTVDFYIDLTTLKTGIEKRDQDMQETLETESYPFAEFFGSLTAFPDSTISGPQVVRVEGKFTVHGVTQRVSISGMMEKRTDGLQVSASWDLNIKDYEIEPPGILFYKVSEVQKIRMDVLLTPKMQSNK